MDQLVATVKATSILPVHVTSLLWGRMTGKESGVSMMQRLGMSYDSRGPGPLIWFHAATTAECAVALPVLFRCLQEYNEKVAVMLTTASLDAYNMLRSSLPRRVKVQLSPMDNPVCASLFMRKWRPTVGIMVESPFHPHLVLAAAQYGCRLALVNAHIEPRDLLAWHAKRAARGQLGQVLKQFSLIVPQSDVDVGRFRIFGASMKQMPGWCNELKYAALMGGSLWHLWKAPDAVAQQLHDVLAGRPHWLAANTVAGEEEVVARLHQQLAAHLSGLVTVLVPQDPGRCPAVQMQLVSQAGLSVCLWNGDTPLEGTAAEFDILLVDDPRHLPLLYSVCDVTLMCNSLISGCTGHNLAQAAVAGCALLLGPHAGSCLNMADELNNAALLAAEDAAAAVRNTGALLEEPLGWEPQEASSSAAANTAGPQAEAVSNYSMPDTLAELQGTSSAAIRQRLQQRLSLQQRDHSSSSRPAAATVAGARPATAMRPRTSVRDPMALQSLARPSTAPAHTTQTLLLSQASHWTDSDCTDCDSLCSDGDLTPRQIVQCLYGSPSSAYTGSFSPASIHTQHYSPGNDGAPQTGGHPWIARRSMMLQGQLSPRVSSSTYTPTRLSRQYSEHIPPSSASHTVTHHARSAHSYAPRSGVQGVHWDSNLMEEGASVSSTPRQSSHAACQVYSRDCSDTQQQQRSTAHASTSSMGTVAGYLALQPSSGARRSLDMSMPASPQSTATGHALAVCVGDNGSEGVRRWDRMFAAATLDPVPWNSPASSTCSPGTPPNLITRVSRHANIASSPAAGAHSNSSRSRQSSGVQHARIRLLSDASTQTELSWLAGLPRPRNRAATSTGVADPSSNMSVLLAAMLGAFSGAQAAQAGSPSMLTSVVMQAPQPTRYDAAVPANFLAPAAHIHSLQDDSAQHGLQLQHSSQQAEDKRPVAATFTPAMLHMRVLEASLAGLVNTSSQNGSSAPQSPAARSRPNTADASIATHASAGVGMLHPAVLPVYSSSLYSPHSVAAERRRSPLSARSAALADVMSNRPVAVGNSAEGHMLSYASSPASMLQDNQLQLHVRVPCSTWTATSTGSTSASHTKPSSPVSLEQSAMYSHFSSSSSALGSNSNAHMQQLMQPGAVLPERSAIWSPLEDADEDGPELSAKSAPDLLSSFEFQPSGSVCDLDQVQPVMLVGDDSSTVHRLSSRPATDSNRRTQSLDIVRAPAAPTTHHSTTAATTTSTGTCTTPTATTSRFLGLDVRAVRAPQPAVAQSDSSRHKTGSHSDPGSPSCSSHPSNGSSAHSDSLWTRSDSGSPTNPALRVSVSGWMGDLTPSRSPVRPAGPSSPLPQLTHSQTSPTASAAVASTPADASRCGSRVPPPTAADALPVLSHLDQGSKASSDTLQRSHSILSPSSSNGSPLRRVRTPRATDPEPVLTTNGVLLPPPSPRASLSSRSSFAPDMPPASPTHHSGMYADLHAPLGSHVSAARPLNITDVQMLASTPMPATACTLAVDAQPDTPTSRLSAMQSVASPFAGSVYDRPDPFCGGVMDRPDPFTPGWSAQGSGSGRMRCGFEADATLVLRGNSICGSTGPNPFLGMGGTTVRSSDGTGAALSAAAAALAQQEQPWLVTPPPLGDLGMQASDSEPPTPTSRLSAMQSITSPFATSAYDRADPFASLPTDQSTRNYAVQGQQGSQGTPRSAPAEQYSPSSGTGTSSKPSPQRSSSCSVVGKPVPGAGACVQPRFAGSRFFSQADSNFKAAAACAVAAASTAETSTAQQHGSLSSTSTAQAAALHMDEEEPEPETPRMRPRESLESCPSTAWHASPAGKAAPQLHLDNDVQTAVGKDTKLEDWSEAAMCTLSQPLSAHAPVRRLFDDFRTALEPSATADEPAAPKQLVPSTISLQSPQSLSCLDAKAQLLHAVLEFATTLQASNSTSSNGAGSSSSATATAQLHKAIQDMLAALCEVDKVSPLSPSLGSAVSRSDASSATLMFAPSGSLPSNSLYQLSARVSAADGHATAAPSATTAHAMGLPSGVAVYQADSPPEGSTPLVLPGIAGPVLVAAPPELASRLSCQLPAAADTAGISPQHAATTSSCCRQDQDGMDVLMANLPQRLPRLRVPSTCIPGALPATARAGDEGRAPITALAITMPHTAPAAAAAAATNASPFRLDSAAQQGAATSQPQVNHAGDSQPPTRPTSCDVAVRPLPNLTCRTSMASRNSMQALATVVSQHVARPLGVTVNLPGPTVPFAPVVQQRPPAQDNKWMAHAAAESSQPNSVHDFMWQDPAAALIAKTGNALPSTSAAAACQLPVTLTGSHFAPTPDSPHPTQPSLHASHNGHAVQLEDTSAVGHAGRNQQARDTSLSRSMLQPHAVVGAASRFVLPANQLSRTTGPAVWVITGNVANLSQAAHAGSNEAVESEVATALLALLQDPLDRRSRGHAAAQAAAKLASGLVNTVWHVLDDTCITPALHGYVATGPSR